MAKVQFDIEDPRIVARLGDLTLSGPVVEIFWRSYNHPSHPISPPQAMQRIIDEALLAQYARDNLPSEVLNQENKVGFLLEVERQDRTVALLRKFHEKSLFEAIQQLPGKSLDGIFTFNDRLTAERYQKMFGLNSSINIEATTEQIAAAKQLSVATINLGGEQKTLTLWDIYQRQNVQGRLAMHEANLEHLKSETKQRVGSLFIMHWAQENLPAVDLAAVSQIVLNEQQKTALLQNMGLHADVHDDNPALRKRAGNITDEQVKAFYEEHKEEFEVVEKVKARHLRVATQELADKVKAELDAGLDFSEAIKKYSIAEDKNNKVPGSLGWLVRKDKERSWLHAVAFTHHKGQVSAPFRSPQGQGEIVFEIIYVDERVDGHLEVTDPTVRYEASRDIALEQIKEEFFALQKQLRDNADIHLNRQALQRKAGK